MSSSTEGTSNSIAFISMSPNSFLLANPCLFFSFFLTTVRHSETSALRQANEYTVSFHVQSDYPFCKMKKWSSVTIGADHCIVLTIVAVFW